MAHHPSILFLGDQWDDLWRRRQQLAWRLAQSDQIERVVYIERPLTVTSFVKLLFGRADRDGSDRWRRVLRNGSWVMPVGKNLSVLSAFAPLPLVRTKLFFRASERVRDRFLLHRLHAHLDLDPQVVCVSHPQLSVEVVQALEPCVLWYDCTEDFVAYPGLPRCARDQMLASDRWLTQNADVVTTVSRTLYDQKRQLNPNSYWLPNAVDTELFLQPQGHFPIPPEIQGRSRPVLAFVGGLNEWAHDWELLDEMASLQPGWTILLIGRLSVSPKTERMLKGHRNVLCVGQKPYWELPSYLVHSDVCFQFYRQGRGNETRGSQKLFLYFAAAKPVVSTPSGDAGSYRDLVRLVQAPREFVRAVHDGLADGLGIRRRRLNAARANSWARRSETVVHLLKCAVTQREDAGP